VSERNKSDKASWDSLPTQQVPRPLQRSRVGVLVKTSKADCKVDFSKSSRCKPNITEAIVKFECEQCRSA
jgi:hypothetical protein